MTRRRGKRQQAEEEESVSLLPVMSLLIILIPFLVGNVAFMHFKSISVQTPGSSSQDSPKKEQQRNVVGSLKVDNEDLSLEILDEDSAQVLVTRKIRRNEVEALKLLTRNLVSLAGHYERFETLLVRVESSPNYDQLVKILEACRVERPEARQLASEEKKSLNVVLLPKGAI